MPSNNTQQEVKTMNSIDKLIESGRRIDVWITMQLREDRVCVQDWTTELVGYGTSVEQAAFNLRIALLDKLLDTPSDPLFKEWVEKALVIDESIRQNEGPDYCSNTTRRYVADELKETYGELIPDPLLVADGIVGAALD